MEAARSLRPLFPALLSTGETLAMREAGGVDLKRGVSSKGVSSKRGDHSNADDLLCFRYGGPLDGPPLDLGESPLKSARHCVAASAMEERWQGSRAQELVSIWESDLSVAFGVGLSKVGYGVTQPFSSAILPLGAVAKEPLHYAEALLHLRSMTGLAPHECVLTVRTWPHGTRYAPNGGGGDSPPRHFSLKALERGAIRAEEREAAPSSDSSHMSSDLEMTSVMTSLPQFLELQRMLLDSFRRHNFLLIQLPPSEAKLLEKGFHAADHFFSLGVKEKAKSHAHKSHTKVSHKSLTQESHTPHSRLLPNCYTPLPPAVSPPFDSPPQEEHELPDNACDRHYGFGWHQGSKDEVELLCVRAETEEGERQRKSQSSGEGDRASDGRGTSAGGTSAARIISADETDASPWDADAAPPELRETLALLKRMGKLALSALEGALQLPRGRLTAAVEGGDLSVYEPTHLKPYR